MRSLAATALGVFLFGSCAARTTAPDWNIDRGRLSTHFRHDPRGEGAFSLTLVDVCTPLVALRPATAAAVFVRFRPGDPASLRPAPLTERFRAVRRDAGSPAERECWTVTGHLIHLALRFGQPRAPRPAAGYPCAARHALRAAAAFRPRPAAPADPAASPRRLLTAALRRAAGTAPARPLRVVRVRIERRINWWGPPPAHEVPEVVGGRVLFHPAGVRRPGRPGGGAP